MLKMQRCPFRFKRSDLDMKSSSRTVPSRDDTHDVHCSGTQAHVHICVLSYTHTADDDEV